MNDFLDLVEDERQRFPLNSFERRDLEIKIRALLVMIYGIEKGGED